MSALYYDYRAAKRTLLQVPASLTAWSRCGSHRSQVPSSRPVTACSYSTDAAAIHCLQLLSHFPHVHHKHHPPPPASPLSTSKSNGSNRLSCLLPHIPNCIKQIATSRTSLLSSLPSAGHLAPAHLLVPAGFHICIHLVALPRRGSCLPLPPTHDLAPLAFQLRDSGLWFFFLSPSQDKPNISSPRACCKHFFRTSICPRRKWNLFLFTRLSLNPLAGPECRRRSTKKHIPRSLLSAL